jgi:predicted Fe-Mo cluster-binding NifX family protein
MMIVCVPSKDDAGLASPLSEHFGSAPYFTLVNTENHEVQSIENKNSHHSHGTCHPMTQLNRYKIDAVICNGMGRRAVEALNYEGIKTLVTNAGSVEEALAHMNDGTASDIDPARACRGHGQHQHDHDHEHEHHDAEHHDAKPLQTPTVAENPPFARGGGQGTGRGQGGVQGRGRCPGICR